MTVKTRKTRLVRGGTVVVADTYPKLALRGKVMIVASKKTVKCNKHGRCAGDWCNGLAVFLTDPSAEREKDASPMGWRRGTEKICLTHLLDENRVAILPEPDETPELPPLPPSDAPRFQMRTSEPSDNGSIVTWDMLAQEVARGDLEAVAMLARRLKSENENLVRRLIDAQVDCYVYSESDHEEMPAKCGAAENPLGRLRFKKYADNEIYCENCLPSSANWSGPAPLAEAAPGIPTTSAPELVVIVCPTCRGLLPGRHGKPCVSCCGYGAVRIRASNLPVYQKPAEPAPEILTEG